MSKNTLWLNFRIELDDPDKYQSTLRQIYYILQEITNEEIINGFWYVRKKDVSYHIRLRIMTNIIYKTKLSSKIKREISKLDIEGITQSVYEPEVCLFGGEAGMKLAHEFFSIDSEFILKFLSHIDIDKLISLDSVSLWLWQSLIKEMNFDLYERWDIWNKVWQLRRFEETESSSTQHYQEKLSKLFLLNLETISDPVGQHIALYNSMYIKWGKKLVQSDRNGLLNRGIRQLIAIHIIFSWNRMGFGNEKQRILASIMKSYYNPEKINI